MTERWKLRPSDLTLLWEGCKRCFYLDVKEGYGRPWTPFPGAFGEMDALLKTAFEGRDVSEIVPELPPGEVRVSEEFLESQPLQPEGRNSAAYFLGKFDAITEFDDGGYGVIDFKISSPSFDTVPLYSRQLHAHAHALENPAGDSLSLGPVTTLGLICLYPEDLRIDADGRYLFDMDSMWIPIERDDDGFERFIDEVLAPLERDEVPDAAMDCEFCEYRAKAQKTGV